MKKLLTPKEVCEILQIKMPTLYKWTSKGLIPMVKIHNLNRFEEEAIIAIIEKQKQQPEADLL